MAPWVLSGKPLIHLRVGKVLNSVKQSIMG
uniref:Uncharacterized protein n=1 Tax=Anguilla anguilla TaxID=7936 RepID=A0A0E9XS72_ANGAN